MKICIIGNAERNYLPYIEKYVDYFNKNKIKHDIILWQREENTETKQENEYHFVHQAKENAVTKFFAYQKFKRFILKILKKNKYDKIIVLTTVPAVTLKSYLIKHYKNKYLLDIRDYTFERVASYKRKVDKLIANSAITTISSRGFMDFLDKNDKIIMNHNINLTQSASNSSSLKEKQVINIGFIGSVRYLEENATLLLKLKNQFRYQLWYIGRPKPDCDLEGFAQNNEITNVSFIGKYNNEQKPELYKNVDIINSIYKTDSLKVTTALPNRLYEACLFKKPIISSKATYLGELIHEYGLGLVVDLAQDDVLAMLNKYVDEFDEQKHLKACNDFLEQVEKDEKLLFSQLKKFVKK